MKGDLDIDGIVATIMYEKDSKSFEIKKQAK